MKSIKEKAKEYDIVIQHISPNESMVDTSGREQFEAGANYVLEKFIDIVNKNTKPNGMEDRAEMAFDMLILIEQLKSNQ